MLEWLESIGNFLSIIIDFIVAFFKNVIELVQLVFKGFAFILEVLAFMPVQYQVVFISLISFAVIVTIVHFGG